MTPRISRAWSSVASGWGQPEWSSSVTAQTNARRRRVFIATLLLSLAVTLAFVWLRPPEYRASARLEITPAAEAPPSLPTAGAGGSVVIATGPASESARPFLTEVQVLTSRPILERAIADPEHTGEKLVTPGADPIGWAQSHLEAVPVTGTNVVELIAVGADPALAARLVNAVVDAYRDQLAESYQNASNQAIAQISDEIAKLETTVTAKRRDVEGFRVRHNIISLERGENEALAQVRNLSMSLNAANERVATAAGKLSALRESAAEGRASASATDPAVASLQQRAAQMRDELTEMERVYTPQYLEREPKAIAIRARLADLEQRIAAQRETGQKTAIAKAQEELSAAQSALSRLQGQIVTGRQEASQFATQFNEYKLQQDSLTDLETAYRDALQRRARLEASAHARMPALGIVEPAAVPQQAWRPLYYRDTGIAVAASLVLALLAMWLIELLNRSEPQPSVVVVQPQPAGIGYAGMPGQLTMQPQPVLPGQRPPPALLGAQPAPERELRQEEVSALLLSADAETRMIVLLLLCGVGVDQVGALRWSDIDAGARRLRVGGPSPREIDLGGALAAALLAAEATPHAPDAPLVASGRNATPESLDARILCAAHDAGLDNPSEVTAESIRHTYIAFLVRARLRFADLPRIVGNLSTEALRAYSALSPSGGRLGIDAVDTVHPAARDLAAERQ